MKNNSFLKIHTIKWSLPDLIEIPLKFILYFILLNYLSKEDFGILNLGLLVFSYHGLAQFGVTDWIMLELPKKFISNKFKDMDFLVRKSLGLSLLNLFILGFIFLSVSYFVVDKYLIFIVFTVFVIQSLLYEYYLHFILLLRFKYILNDILYVKIIFFVSKFIISYIAIVYFGFLFYLLCEAIIFLLPISLMYFWRKVKLVPIITDYMSLIKKGFPFFIISFLNLVVGHIDRWVVIALLSIENFASYSLIIYVATAILIFPSKFLSIFGQYIKEYFEISKNKLTYLKNVFMFCFLIITALIIFLILVKYIMPTIVTNYLQKYIEILDLISPMLCLVLLRFINSLINLLLNLELKQKFIIKSQFIYLTIFTISLPMVGFLFGYELNYLLWTINFVLFIQMSVLYYLYFIDKPKNTWKNTLSYNICIIIFILSVIVNVKLMVYLHIILISLIILHYIIFRKEFKSNYNFISNKKFLNPKI